MMRHNEVSGENIATGLVLSYQTSGDFARWNPHFHGLLLEGGLNEGGRFVYIPISNTRKMTELFRRLVIKYFTDKKLLNDDFARNLLAWKNSGFSIDNSVRIAANDDRARESLAQYIARCPVSSDKIHYEPFHGKVLFKTPKYNEYFKENFREFDALEFIAEITAHIPPKHKQYIRRYGLYSSRNRGIWDRSPHVMRLAPEGWKQKRNGTTTSETSNTEIQENAIDEKKQRSTWARLIKKVYGTDPLVCPQCGSEMKIIAIIMDTEETTRILEHLVKV